ncbi:hypothetical protein [Calothrix rhizosoleniae]|uniref:hypothetical protein n=1 Tax=Calothrix rhizosoleniae TaxID=888997 RepID=UPI000B49CFF5|nr:hypothetical protein [Calothrix rhizosoleniae]
MSTSENILSFENCVSKIGLQLLESRKLYSSIEIGFMHKQENHFNLKKQILLSLTSLSLTLTSGFIGFPSQAVAQTTTDDSGNNYYLGNVEILGNGIIRINYSKQSPCKPSPVMRGGATFCIRNALISYSMLARCYEKSYSTDGTNWYKAASGKVFRILIDRACS